VEGNFRSRHFAEGGYEPIAEVLFRELNVHECELECVLLSRAGSDWGGGDLFCCTDFLEFDNERSGGFEPLRFLPKGKVVVLGLVSSKVPQLEDKAAIKARIQDAAKFAPLDQLSLSPQCGFSSTSHGNDVSVVGPWETPILKRDVF
jgi:5-methyltetrahydropteroyltriglutamate--homocysteine methyltransferase